MRQAAFGAAPARTPERALVVERDVVAVLRWRWRLQRRTLTHKQASALRLLPVLLHGSFQHPQLRGDAPGVEGIRFRPGWGALSNSFGLPPPFRVQRGRRLVEAIVAVPTESGVEALVIAAAGLGAPEVERIRQRLAAAQDVLALGGVHLRSGLLAGTPDDEAGELVRRALAFGGLCAGSLPAPFFPAAAAAWAAKPLSSELAAQAPAPLAALSLMLLGNEPAPDPLRALRTARGQGAPARQLADPALFCAEWIGPATSTRPLLRMAVRLVSPDAQVRAAASDPGPQPTIDQMLQLGSALTLRFLRAARRSRLWRDRAVRQRLLQDVLGPGIPRALLPAVRQALATAPQQRAGEGLSRGRNGRWEFKRSGAVLARARTPEMAQIRALALGAVSQTNKPGGSWDQIGARLARADGAPLLLVSVEHAAGVGPPFDPLNRGVQRRYGISRALIVNKPAGARPRARTVMPDRAVSRVIQAAARGHGVEVMAASPEAQPAAARLSRVAQFVRAAGPVPGDAAVEAGGEVFALRDGQLRRYGLHPYVRRPRACQPDPEAPDLALSPDRPGVSRERWGPQAIECRLDLINETTAYLLYVDGEGNRLREEVPLEQLEGHLKDAQHLLRVASPPRMLMVRASAQLEQQLRRTPPLTDVTEAAVAGELPFGLTVEIGGELFGPGTGLGWEAAAAQVASTWPPGARGRISVRSLEVLAAGSTAGGLLVLYARSVVLRRLRSILSREQFQGM